MSDTLEKKCGNCGNVNNKKECNACISSFNALTQIRGGPSRWISKKDDDINPSHYKDRKIEVIDYMQDNMTEEQFKGYLEGNVIKYISRYKKKNGLQDLKKCQWYLNKLIEVSCE